MGTWRSTIWELAGPDFTRKSECVRYRLDAWPHEHNRDRLWREAIMYQRRCFLKTMMLSMTVWLACIALATGQDSSPSSPGPTAQKNPQTDDAPASLSAQMEQLRVALNQVRDELAGSRRESEQLRREIQVMREQLDVIRHEPAQSNDPVSTLAENQQVLSAKVEDQYQTKVESGSKYRVRLSGIALVNLFSTRGAVDNLDFPRTAQPRSPEDSNGAFGGTVRQSTVRLEVFGPEWRGARTSGDVSFDFTGSFPSAPEGVTTGMLRLRTATINFDWPNTSIVAGQDAPFFSPLSPTSLATAAYPALSSSGNIWTWTPQIHVEHRIGLSDRNKMIVQWGILDALTGELPSEYNRTPTAGERSRVPAYALRLALQRASDDRNATVGAGAYYSRQNWGSNRTVDAWAATADWELPLGRWFTLSGEAYRGRAIAGLGAGASGSVLFTGSSVSAGSVLPLDSAGGWSQFKFKPVQRIEFNAAFGEDYPFRSGLNRLAIDQSIQASPVSRNANGFVNVIYQARSNLLFSVEYRRLWTSCFFYPKEIADHVSVSSGIIF